MEPFPIPAPAFNGNSRSVDASAAFEWLRQGFAIFLINGGYWVTIALILIVGMLALLAAWLPGQMLLYLLAPVVGGGVLEACRKASADGAFAIQDIGAGFKHNTSNLLVLGAIFMGASLLIKAVVVLLFGGSIAGGMMMPGAVGVGVLLGGSLLALLLSSLLLVPLSMAMWFAPALVFFNNMPPVEALKASFNACLKNILPFLIYGLVVFVLMFFAALPAGLGFLVLIPVLSGSLYVSYRDIFVAH